MQSVDSKYQPKMFPDVTVKNIEKWMDDTGLDGMQRIAISEASYCLVSQFIRSFYILKEDVIPDEMAVETGASFHFVFGHQFNNSEEIRRLVSKFDNHTRKNDVKQVTAKTCRRIIKEVQQELAPMV